MASSEMLRRVALVRIDVSEELSGSYIRVFLRSVHRLLVTANVVSSSPIFVTMMKEGLSSSETSVLTRATRSNIPEDAILHSSCKQTSHIASHNGNCTVHIRVKLQTKFNC
jgi:hypothetical protein